MSRNPSDTTQLWADLLVEELVRCGADLAVLAPGSRSTPLVAACVRNPSMRTRLHVDERGAAFFALGHARATGRPAVWLTTSGTAVANGLPAVVEASQDDVPLLLLTADRPPELRGNAANQTTDQPSIFAPYVRWRVDLPAPDPAVDPAYVLTTVDQAVYRTTGAHPGPVHVNVPFRKPLEPGPDRTAPRSVRGLEAWSEGRSPYTRYAGIEVRSDVGELEEALQTASRPLIVAGRLDLADAGAVRRFADGTGWPLAADVTSQLLLGSGDVLRHADLVAAHASGLPVPDAVIEFGRPGVSSRLRGWLARSGARVHAVIAEGPGRIDPEHRTTHRLEGIRGATEALSARTFSASGAWADAWREADRRAAEAVRELLPLDAPSEPSVAREVSEAMGEGHALWLASSMPIRDMNAFSVTGNRPLLVAANRGVSGIDGTIASAAGLADGLEAPVTVMIGDLALLHDLNALLLARDRAMTIVLLNNDGGGIFSFLPIAGHSDVFEPWFTAPHGLAFRSAADQFGLAYEAPETVAAFREAYARAVASGTACLIEVRTDREANLRLHRDIEAGIGRRMSGR